MKPFYSIFFLAVFQLSFSADLSIGLKCGISLSDFYGKHPDPYFSVGQGSTGISDPSRDYYYRITPAVDLFTNLSSMTATFNGKTTTSTSRSNIITNFNSNDFGIPFGIGSYLSIGKHDILIDIRYSPYFVSFVKTQEDFIGKDLKHETLSFSLGYSITLTKLEKH